MYAYAGKILRVDLTKGKTTTELLEKELASLYVGGKGFGAKILFEEMETKKDPYDPQTC